MRILLADAQPKVRFALRTLLQRQAGFEVVGEARDVQELWAQLETARPDLLLLDWDLPGQKVADLVPVLHWVRPEVAVVVLSSRYETRCYALQAGASAFVSKSDLPEQLLEILVRCCQGISPAEDESSISTRRSNMRPSLRA